MSNRISLESGHVVRSVFGMLLCCTSSATVFGAAVDMMLPHQRQLAITSSQIHLFIGTQIWRFVEKESQWCFEAVEVNGKPVVVPLSPDDSFYVGGGRASSYTILNDTSEVKSIRFTIGSNTIEYSADARQFLPIVRVCITGPTMATCAFRTAASDVGEHGAWVTRGYVDTDADGHEDFIDSSNPLVFGHSIAGGVDTGYLIIPKVKEHIQPNGRSEQKSDTWFKSARLETQPGQYCGTWQVRMGAGEPKEFAILFDRDLGGRFSDVCDKYYADAVDTLVDIAAVQQDNFDPEKCLQVMPVRLSSPDAFIPGWGWMMDEFQNASYPFAHDAVWQQPGLLAFEGLATGRDWERNFAQYLIDKTPLEGPDGKSFFVRRPGGLTRWAYFASFKNPFPHLDGGTWWQADLLYRTALALGDDKLRHAAVDMVLHDLNVKLDLNKMEYPPCWSAIDNRIGNDHRDDWFKTPGLAYCAYMAATVAYPETKDPRYLEIADRICQWFAGFIVPEIKLNFLQGNNMHAVFSHYLVLAFLDRFERSGDRQYLDMARDMAWVHIMTTCTTSAKDRGGKPMTGTTCVGVRGCVDYDCAPNLCHEKDLTFVHIIGPLLDYVSGPGYAKYLALHRIILAKDSWTSAWAADLRDTNLRTMYDTYARGMANLIYALNRSSDPQVLAVDKLVSKSETWIPRQRDIVLVNGTRQSRQTRLQVRFLQPGAYEVKLDGEGLGRKSHRELDNGLSIAMPPNSTKRLQVQVSDLESPSVPLAASYDSSITYLSDLTPFAAQRGNGNPQPAYRKDRSIDDHPISISKRMFDKGLGCVSNTVLLYDLNGRFEKFQAVVGIDGEVADKTNPKPSVFFTVHVDGVLRFESGPVLADTPALKVEVDIRNARMLLLRMSCNWDDNGDSKHDHGDWADASLIGCKSP